MATKYKVKITRSGFIYIVITILISVAAINTGNNLLYIISSLMLALMALSGAASLANLSFIRISLEPAEEIFAHIPAKFNLRVTKRFGGSFFLTLETLFGSVAVPYLKGISEEALWLTLPKRGKTAVPALQVHSGFPLGFFRRFKQDTLDLPVLVYPKPAACVLPVPTGGIRGMEKRSDTILGELGDEIKELRTYRPSDPLKWVEWKATARRGRMVVREFYHLEGDTLMIDLSMRTDSWEDRLSQACYLVLEGQRRKLMVGLKLPDREVTPGLGERHRRSLMEALALA
jgi:uncharacterized protein (DUF58 family)